MEALELLAQMCKDGTVILTCNAEGYTVYWSNDKHTYEGTGKSLFAAVVQTLVAAGAAKTKKAKAQEGKA